MADLVTHLATAMLPAAFWPGALRWLGPLALGTALPDLASNVPGLIYDRVVRDFLWLPDELLVAIAVFHQPVGCALLCVIIARVVVPEHRREALVALLGGSAFHFGVDLLQDHHGQGYFMTFPLSSTRFELGWMGSEATVPWAPLWAALTAVAWAGRWWWTRPLAAPVSPD